MDELKPFYQQTREFEKLLEQAQGAAESVRRQLEGLRGPSVLQATIDRIMSDIEAGLAQNSLIEQIEQITLIGLPLQKQIEGLQQLHEARGAADNARELFENLSGPLVDWPLHEERARIVHPIIPEIAPFEPEPGPAVKILTRIQQELDAEKAKKQDQRHTVFLVIYLPNGTKVLVDSLRTDDGQVIQVEGTDADTNGPVIARVGALGFQYEFITFEHGPNLYLVE